MEFGPRSSSFANLFHSSPYLLQIQQDRRVILSYHVIWIARNIQGFDTSTGDRDISLEIAIESAFALGFLIARKILLRKRRGSRHFERPRTARLLSTFSLI